MEGRCGGAGASSSRDRAQNSDEEANKVPPPKKEKVKNEDGSSRSEMRRYEEQLRSLIPGASSLPRVDLIHSAIDYISDLEEALEARVRKLGSSAPSRPPLTLLPGHNAAPLSSTRQPLSPLQTTAPLVQPDPLAGDALRSSTLFSHFPPIAEILSRREARLSHSQDPSSVLHSSQISSSSKGSSNNSSLSSGVSPQARKTGEITTSPTATFAGWIPPKSSLVCDGDRNVAADEGPQSESRESVQILPGTSRGLERKSPFLTDNFEDGYCPNAKRRKRDVAFVITSHDASQSSIASLQGGLDTRSSHVGQPPPEGDTGSSESVALSPSSETVSVCESSKKAPFCVNFTTAPSFTASENTSSDTLKYSTVTSVTSITNVSSITSKSEFSICSNSKTTSPSRSSPVETPLLPMSPSHSPTVDRKSSNLLGIHSSEVSFQSESQ